MRTHQARTPFHSLRATIVAVSIVSLSAGAHFLAGGTLPAPVIILATLALAGLATTVATRFKLTFPAMTAVLGAGQLVLHEAFTALSGTLGGGMPGKSHLHHTVPELPPAGPPLAIPSGSLHVHEPGSLAGVLMVLAHIVATVICALLLAKGEDALWALAAWLRPLVRLPRAVTPDAVAAPAVGFPPSAATPPPWRNLRQHSRRGPPSAVVLQ